MVLSTDPSASELHIEDVRVHADIIILANDFEALCWFYPLIVYGRNGRSLYDVWDEREGPQAYMGIAMDNSQISSSPLASTLQIVTRRLS